MKRKYIVHYYLDFGNTYHLFYTDNGEDLEDCERITRKEAERLARSETQRRKDDYAFAGYADEYVYPYDLTQDERDSCTWDDNFIISGRVVERKQKNK